MLMDGRTDDGRTTDTFIYYKLSFGSGELKTENTDITTLIMWIASACSADGRTLLTDKDAILERLTDHINSVLNRPTAVSDDDINRLLQKESNLLLDEFPTATETKKTIRHLSSDKAPGANAISTEIFKADRLPMTWKLTELWRKAILQELKDAS